MLPEFVPLLVLRTKFCVPCEVILPAADPVPTVNDPLTPKLMLDCQRVLALLYVMVLSVAPFNVIPPPSAVVSVAPVVVMVVIAPATGVVPPVAEYETCVALSTEVTIYVPPVPRLPAPAVADNAEPGIRPVVDDIPEITAAHGPVPVIDPTVPVVLTVALGTEPSSIFLSSTVRTVELTDVVLPLTVRLPLNVTLPPTFKFSLTARPPVITAAPDTKELLEVPLALMRIEVVVEPPPYNLVGPLLPLP